MPSASYSTSRPSPLQASPRSWIVQKNVNYRDWLDTCPHAQTLIASCPYHTITWVIPLPCKQWSCRWCAERKCRRLAARTRDAKPNRMLTLTVDPKLWKTPREAFDGTRRHIPTFFAELRKRFAPIEYLRVTELTHNGWPHYHFLIRSGFLPHAVLKNLWHKLTGAIIVDVRPVDARWSAYTYLLKYLCKLAFLGWTERHVSYSRDFFPPEKPKTADPLPIELRSQLAMHPDTYLRNNEAGSFVAKLTPSIFAASHDLDNLQGLTDDYFTPGNEPSREDTQALQ